MNRRSFLAAMSAVSICNHLPAASVPAKKNMMIIWLAGGPPTIDMWDLKPGTKNGGPFNPISTTGDFEISEHMPLLAKSGKDFSIVRTMSTREADHARASYYLHTGYVPNPSMKHPSIGSIISREIGPQRTELDIPAYCTIGRGGFGGGYLGAEYNPFKINSNGDIPNVGAPITPNRIKMLNLVERSFSNSDRGQLPKDHSNNVKRAIRLTTSGQLESVKIENEPQVVRDAYGVSQFGKAMLMGRRLMQTGVPCVEVSFGGWDLHQNVHTTLEQKLPELDKVVSSLFSDLKRLDMWHDTAIIIMGEFGRTPRINANAGRDHWSRTWSAVLAGGLFKGGLAYGATTKDGSDVHNGRAFTASDLLVTGYEAMGIDPAKIYMSRAGRPMKLGNGGRMISGKWNDDGSPA